jgi:hypothetical protein
MIGYIIKMNYDSRLSSLLNVSRLVTFLFFFTIIRSNLNAQYENKWLSVGSLHNWYSEIGSERVLGYQPFQQFGLRWPGIYDYQDMQASKSLWIGARNFTDQEGRLFSYKVVHVGPRVTGAGSFTPIEFKLVSRFDPPLVFVDGDFQFGWSYSEVDELDPSILADRMIVNRVNNQLGLTVSRRIMQFSQEYHDNYHLSEYVITNTGNEALGLTSRTLEDVYIFFQHRYSILRQTRFLFGNATGWGINTMIDHRGDGQAEQYNDPSDEDFRATFAWHGYYPDRTVSYNNIGGPIQRDDRPVGLIDPADTVGRLGAAHFVGVVTLHADRSAADDSDYAGQPSTMRHFGSDEFETSGNDPFNIVRMLREYNVMASGRLSRHAFIVHPEGDFENQTTGPSLGTPGGFSNTFGYGPYTIGPGESIRIVFAEAASGLSREQAVKIGRAYKDSGSDDNAFITVDGVSMTKNQWALTSRDSLFHTFRRALSNHESGFSIPKSPLPPSIFEVTSGGDRIVLSWDVYDDPSAPAITGFEIYRARGRVDSTYHLIHSADPTEREFHDTTPVRGLQYFYYIVSVGDPASNTGTGMTPSGALRSNRYYTQTYDPAFLRRPAGRPVQRGENIIDVASVLRDGTNTIEFEFADNINGRADGFRVTDFYINVDRWLVRDHDTIFGTTRYSVPSEMLPISFIDRPVGSRRYIDLDIDLSWPETADTVFFEAYFHIEVFDVFDINMIRLYINGTEVALPENIVSPYKSRMDAIRIVPNPYNISVAEDPGHPLSWGSQDRIAFLNIPGDCTIRIYTELGELVRTILHTDGSGDAFWDLTTSSRQVVVSGIYIAVVENHETGERAMRKFVIIR